jgi:hypothetical protein
MSATKERRKKIPEMTGHESLNHGVLPPPFVTANTWGKDRFQELQLDLENKK